ncbi:MAG: ABC transporter ATP-binding protein [Cyanobacteriota bacterium SKYGB_h_bin112]|nr:ABC transporter ATP-binding protein [Cyanobacteriota bacterium SKYGB_h_bin112]
MTTEILDVRNLRVEFHSGSGVVTAVDGIDFQVKQGETLGIVGESGSGKSVTALAIMGLVPYPGSVTADSLRFRASADSSAIDLLQLSPRQLQQLRGSKLAMVFQEPMSSLNPVYSIGFQLMEAILQHQQVTLTQARHQAIARLQEVSLLREDDDEQTKQAMLNRYPHQLSGGQIQRVMIAMAICSDPVILIADEPTTALDVTVQAEILALLRRIQQDRGMSIIFITHDLGVIASVADTVVVMYQGKVVESGSLAQIFSRPHHPYTQGLLACRPSPERRLRVLPTVADFLTSDRINARTVLDDQQGELGSPLSTTEMEQRLRTLANEPPLLTVQDLQVAFPVKGLWGQTQRYVMAVNGVSFDVYLGETLGLVGESGCGKTTLARTLLQLIPATAGRIIFAGQDVIAQAKRYPAALRNLRREMQIIFQNPYGALNPRMTIAEIVTEPLRIYQQGNRRSRLHRAIELLERVGLDKTALHRYPHEFSGGQRQRICIARALVLNPRFIICDESVSALDVSVQAQVLNLLKSLQRELNLTYIFISHDLGVVKFMSDRIMVMHQGAIVEIGSSDDIYWRPQQPYTQKLIQAIPQIDPLAIQQRAAARNSA